MKTIKYLYTVLALFITSAPSFAQFHAINTGKLEVYASVNQGGEPMSKVIATLYEDVANTGEWKQVQTMKTNTHGEFSFKLDFNSKYRIEMAKANYVTKNIAFDTNVHNSTINSQDFYFNVELAPGSNTPASAIPVGNVFYHKEKKIFDYELNYAKAEK